MPYLYPAEALLSAAAKRMIPADLDIADLFGTQDGQETKGKIKVIPPYALSVCHKCRLTAAADITSGDELRIERLRGHSVRGIRTVLRKWRRNCLIFRNGIQN
jgi:hypothetical protein